MSLTRRSFVKKSSYSAAAVTVLGTGVGLASDGDTDYVPPQVYKAEKIELTYAQFGFYQFTAPSGLGGGPALLLGLKKLVNSPNFGKNPLRNVNEKLLASQVVFGPGPPPWRIVSQNPLVAPPQGPAAGIAEIPNGDGTSTYTITFNQAHVVVVTNFPVTP